MPASDRAKGAALLLSLALLSIAGMLGAALLRGIDNTLIMIRTERLLHGASLAADLAIHEAMLTVTRGMTPMTAPQTIDQLGYAYSVRIQAEKVAVTTIDAGFSMGSGQDFLRAHHFEIRAAVSGPRNTAWRVTEGFFVIGPDL